MIKRLSFALASAVGLFLAPVQSFAKPEQIAEVASGEEVPMPALLREALQFNWGFQGQTQGAGTPNEIGIGGFLPLAFSGNGVVFIDALANVNLPDIGNSSSIVNTEVAGTTISTSTRLGYRWLNGDRSWMFGVTAGYDSRPMATGQADTGVVVANPQTVFFQQVAASLEAVSNSWNLNGYALVPVGNREYALNSIYGGGSLQTYGIDAGYSITPDFQASVGYYYQDGDLNNADGSGVRGRLAYNISNGLTVGTNLSYDQAFKTRFSADVKYRFGSNGYGAPKKQKPPVKPVIQALSSTPGNRNVRVHDCSSCWDSCGWYTPSCY